MISIFKSSAVPIRGLRTSMSGADLGPGYFQKIDNFRWDTGVLKVRAGIATVADASSGPETAPSTTCLGAWSGSLNGQWYVVSAWLVSQRTAIYSLNLSTGVFTELTAAGSTTRPNWGGTGTTNNLTSAGESRMGNPITITGATNATPIVVTASSHKFETGMTVAITGVLGNTAANGNWTVTRVSSSTFSLDGSVGNGNYTSGGTATAYSDVEFCVHTTQRRVVGSTSIPPIDYLTIQNGIDWPVVYNPAGAVPGTLGTDPVVTYQKNVGIPVGGNSFDFYGTKLAKFQVATASGQKTFTVDPALQARWVFADSSVAPYNTGSDYCIDLDVASPNTNDWAKIAFGAGVSFPGEQISWFVQVSSTNLDDFKTYSKVEVSADDVTYHPIYDPGNSNAALTVPPIQTTADLGGNRFELTFSLKNVPSSARSIRYIRVTRTLGKTISYTMTILGIYGASTGNGFYGGSELAIAYSDHYTGIESGRVTGTSQGYDLLKNVGGPSVVTSGSSTIAGQKIPASETVLFDYKFFPKNLENGTIYGGLSGPVTQNYAWASHIDVYIRTAEEAALKLPFLYWNSVALYDRVLSVSDHQWKMFGDYCESGVLGGTPLNLIPLSTAGIGYGQGNVDRELRDPGCPAPSAYNIGTPRAKAVASANQRTFVGAVRDTSGNYIHPDLYFSELGFPFRFSSVQSSETDASRCSFPGQKLRAIVMTSAAASGASVIYVLTDQAMHALGTAGGFVGSGYDASALATTVQVNFHGTNEPGSVAERSGVIFFADQEGQIIRFYGGQARSISRLAVDDKTKNVPAAYRGKMTATIFKDRYYLGYVPSAGTANTKILGWNEVMEEWEFDDTLPSTVIAQKLCRSFDNAILGSGQRLLIFGSSDSKVYAYEEGSTEPGSAVGPAVSLRTGEFQSPDNKRIRVKWVMVMADAHTATLNVDRYLKPRNTQFRTSMSLAATESKPIQIMYDTLLPTEQTATGKSEDGWSEYLDFNGNLGAGKIIYRIEADVEHMSVEAGER